jgi:RNA polymerase sigma factor (sigma-70 family)
MDSSAPDRSLTDELIVIQCQLGEPAGFDALILRWHQPVWKYVRRLLGDDPSAPDVAQDVWVRVIRGIGRVREPRKFSAWLFGVARRTVVDHLRGRYAGSVEIAVDVTELPDAVDDDRDELERSLDRLDDALGTLPVIERETLALFYLRELSLIEMAEVLAVPVGTVKSRLHRARKLLRRRLDRQEGLA